MIFEIHSNSSVTESSKSSFSPSQVAYLFTFLAQQIAKDDQCLTVPKEKFEHVLNVLTDNNEISHREERQQALFDMLNARGLDYFDQDHLIYRAQQVEFYRILEMIYEKRKEYDKLLRTYINDRFRQSQVFSFLQRVFYEDISDDKRNLVEKSVLDDIHALIEIDLKKTTMIIILQLYPYIPLVLKKLETKKEVHYDFLKHLLELKESGSQPTTPLHGSRQDPLTSHDTYESLIDLMCQLEPKTVASYLRTKSSHYRPHKVLELGKFSKIIAR